MIMLRDNVMPALTYSIRPDGLRLQGAQGWLALTPVSPRSIRIRYSLKPDFSTAQSLLVVAKPEANVLFTVEETPDRLVFSTSELTIKIDRQTAAFTYQDSQGRLLTREPARGGKTLEPVDVVVSAFDDATMTEDDDRQLRG
jgi:alpha-D-xyloside xylohydrolase